MNERIKELDKQARLWAMDNTTFPISSHIPSGYTQKFAELILADVIAIIEDPKSYNKCVFTNFDESRARCVSVELIKEINQKFKDVK